MSTEQNSDSADFYIKGVLSGDISILGRAITLVESKNTKHRALAGQILDGIIEHSGNSFRLGITGVPGVGKSTFIESFGKIILQKGYRLAVLAIDPSSAKSKGSILGDKIRMEELSSKPNVYIRPSPSGGSLGGVIRSTYETILLCEAAGYNFIIIETVGVGQSEVAVSGITDFFLLLMLAGAGDELQGIKRGIMEMADGLAITKADGENALNAKAARTEYAHALHLMQLPESGWRPQVLTSSALTNEGMPQLCEMIEKYEAYVKSTGYFSNNRQKQQQLIFLNNLEEALKERFYSDKKVIAKIETIKTHSSVYKFSNLNQIIDEFLGNKAS